MPGASNKRLRADSLGDSVAHSVHSSEPVADFAAHTLPRATLDGNPKSRLRAIALIMRERLGDALSVALAGQIEGIAATLPQSNPSHSNHAAALISSSVVPNLNQIDHQLKVVQHDLKIMKNAAKRNAVSSSPSPNHPKEPDKLTAPNLDRLCIIEGDDASQPNRIKELLLNNPLIVNGTAAVDRFNVHPNNKIYIHCATANCKTTVTNILTEHSIEVRSVRMRSTLFKFSRLSKSTSSDELINWLENSDNRFRDNKGACKHFKYIALDETHRAIVLEVQPQLAKRLHLNPTANYMLNKITVSPFTKLLICGRCSRLGHSASHCRVRRRPDELACPSCGSNEHEHNRCTVKSDSDPLLKNCANCKRANLHSNGHCAWEKSCPIRREYLNRLISSRSIPPDD